VDRLKTVLESYGYYQSLVTVKIEGLGLNSGGLADALNALPKGRDAMVAVSFELGPRTMCARLPSTARFPYPPRAHSLSNPGFLPWPPTCWPPVRAC